MTRKRMMQPGLTLSLRHAAVMMLLVTSLPAAHAQQEPSVPVYVEDSPLVQDAIAKAAHLRSQDRLTEAAGAYQDVIEDHGRKLYAVGPLSYIDAAVFARRSVREDADLLEAYRNLHEPTAERLLAEATAPTPDESQLASVYDRFALTRSGLDAGLTLAGLLLEQGRTVWAGVLLEELASHPALDEMRARWLTLRAWTAALQGEEAGVIRDLETADPQQAATIRGVAAELRDRPRAESITSMRTLPPATTPEQMRMPLWTVRFPSVEMLETLTQTADQNEQRVMQTTLEGLSAPHALPVVRGDRLYINDSMTVLALDRTSGRLIWTARDKDEIRAGLRNSFTQYRRNHMADLRGVAATDDAVYAVFGHPSPYYLRHVGRGQREMVGSSTLLVAVDAATGEVQWRIGADEIDESLNTAFFQGTPVVCGDLVITIARRMQQSRFQDAYLIAVDRATGEPVWRRHLSSSMPSMHIHLGADPAHIVERDGLLYIADHVGAVTCVEGRTGHMRWLRVVPVAKDMDELRRHRPASEPPWSVNVPVMIEAGLVVQPYRDDGEGLLLDPRTGEVIRQLAARTITKAHYLMPAGGDLLSVDSTVTLLDGRTLETKWSRSLSEPAARATVTTEYALIPTTSRVHVLDLKDGSVRASLAVDGPGNLLAMPDQVLLARGDDVSSFMVWDQAYAQLSAQAEIGRDRLNPKPALDLAYLALTADKPAAVLEGVDDALLVLRERIASGREDAAPKGRGVFEQILQLTDPVRGGDRELRQELFDRLARNSAGPDHEVAYHLAYGEFLEQTGRFARAVDHYQAILGSPTLSGRLHDWQGGKRRSGLEARMRLSQLLREQGDHLYRKYEQRAEAELEQLISEPLADEKPLLELARRYPLSEVASTAQIEAARVMREGGEVRLALAMLRRLYHELEEGPVMARLAGEIAQAYINADEPAQAGRWLRQVARNHPHLTPMRDGVPVPVARWLDELKSVQLASRNLPTLAIPLSQPRAIRGRLLVPHHQPRTSWPTDRAVIAEADHVSLLVAPDMEVKWRTELSLAAPQLLAITDEQILLLDAEAGSLVSLDASDGEVGWVVLLSDRAVNANASAPEQPGDGEVAEGEVGDLRQQVAERLGDQLIAELQLDAVMGELQIAAVQVEGGPARINLLADPNRPDEEDAEETKPGLRVAVNDQVICLGDPAGKVVAVDRMTGKTRWQAQTDLDGVDRISLGEDMVAVSGVTQRGGEEQHLIHVFDVSEGRPRFEPIEPPSRVKFLAADRMGLLLFATASSLEARQLTSGATMWQLQLRDDGLSTVLAHADGSVVLLDQDHRLALLDSMTGEIRWRVSGLAEPSLTAPRLRRVEEQWHVLTASRVAMITGEGGSMWRDAIAEPDRLMVMQLMGQDHVAAVALRLGPNVSPLVAQRALQQGKPIVPQQAQIRIRIVNGQRQIERIEPQTTDGYEYRLYIFDRQGGAILDQYSLGPLDRDLLAERSMMLDNHVLLGTRDAVVIIPASSAR